MNLFRRRPAQDASSVEGPSLSVFYERDETSLRRPGSECADDATDVAFTELDARGGDDAPYGPAAPELAPASPQRKKRRISLGGARGGAATEGLASPPSQLDVPAAASPVDAPSGSGGPRPSSALPAGRSALGARLRGWVNSRRRGVKATSNLPVRVLIGFLPEVTQRDARSYAQGVAEKHVENIEGAYFDVFPHQGGFVYEVHEGGTGAAFTPGILAYFEGLGPFRSDVEARMHIRTATRTVEVVRKPAQIEALLLPESAELPSTPQPPAGSAMPLAMNKRTGALVAGATVFITGFFAAILVGTFMRLVPVEDIQRPAPETLRPYDLPSSQWALRLRSVPEGKYVRALRFDKKANWRVELADLEGPTEPPDGAIAPTAPTPTPTRN